MSPAGTDENGNYYILTYDHQSETFVRKTEDGQILATLNSETGQWEKVEPIEIPLVPEGANGEIWRLACLASLQDETIQEYGWKPEWDSELNTVVWKNSQGVAKAYNRKFGFIGEVAGESRWIVRRKVGLPTGNRFTRDTEIADARGQFRDFGFNIKSPPERNFYGDLYYLEEVAGMVVGVREIVDFSEFTNGRSMKDYLEMENYPLGFEVSENTNLSVWEALKVRGKVGEEIVEFLILVNPVGDPDYEISVPKGCHVKKVPFEEFWSKIQVGSMLLSSMSLYTEFGDPREMAQFVPGKKTPFFLYCLGSGNLNIFTSKTLGLPGSSALTFVPKSDFLIPTIFDDPTNFAGLTERFGPVFMETGVFHIGGAYY